MDDLSTINNIAEHVKETEFGFINIFVTVEDEKLLCSLPTNSNLNYVAFELKPSIVKH